MTGQTFSFSHCMPTLFIWCCRVRCFAWWTWVFWEHHETLVFIEKMGALEQLCLRTPKSLIWHWEHPHRVASLAQQFVIKLKLHSFQECFSWQTIYRIYDGNISISDQLIFSHSYQSLVVYLTTSNFATRNIVCGNYLTAKNIFNWSFKI